MVVRKKPASRGSQSKPKKGTLRLQLSSEKQRGTHGRRKICTPKDQQDMDADMVAHITPKRLCTEDSQVSRQVKGTKTHTHARAKNEL